MWTSNSHSYWFSYSLHIAFWCVFSSAVHLLFSKVFLAFYRMNDIVILPVPWKGVCSLSITSWCERMYLKLGSLQMPGKASDCNLLHGFRRSHSFYICFTFSFPGFCLMLQDVCWSSSRHDYTPASKKGGWCREACDITLASEELLESTNLCTCSPLARAYLAARVTGKPVLVFHFNI